MSNDDQTIKRAISTYLSGNIPSAADRQMLIELVELAPDQSLLDLDILRQLDKAIQAPDDVPATGADRAQGDQGIAESLSLIHALKQRLMECWDLEMAQGPDLEDGRYDQLLSARDNIEELEHKILTHVKEDVSTHPHEADIARITKVFQGETLSAEAFAQLETYFASLQSAMHSQDFATLAQYETALQLSQALSKDRIDPGQLITAKSIEQRDWIEEKLKGYQRQQNPLTDYTSQIIDKYLQSLSDLRKQSAEQSAQRIIHTQSDSITKTEQGLFVMAKFLNHDPDLQQTDILQLVKFLEPKHTEEARELHGETVQALQKLLPVREVDPNKRAHPNIPISEISGISEPLTRIVPTPFAFSDLQDAMESEQSRAEREPLRPEVESILAGNTLNAEQQALLTLARFGQGYEVDPEQMQQAIDHVVAHNQRIEPVVRRERLKRERAIKTDPTRDEQVKTTAIESLREEAMEVSQSTKRQTHLLRMLRKRIDHVPDEQQQPMASERVTDMLEQLQDSVPNPQHPSFEYFQYAPYRETVDVLTLHLDRQVKSTKVRSGHVGRLPKPDLFDGAPNIQNPSTPEQTREGQ